VYLIKSDSDGDTIWTKIFGGSSRDEGFSVQQTSDEGYIITGRTDSFGAGLMDVYLIKINSNGDTTWTKTFGGSNKDEGFSVLQTLDGGYIIAGRTESFGSGSRDLYLIRTNNNGNILWSKVLGGNYIDEAYSIQQVSDSSFIIAGNTESFGAGNFDIWLVKIGSNISAVHPPNKISVQYSLSQNYPNPFNPVTSIQYTVSSRQFVTLIVYDLLGREIATLVNEEKPAGEYEVEFNAVGTSRDLSLPSGIYFYRLKAGEYSETRKMVLIQ